MSLAERLSYKRIGAVYVLIGIAIIFCLWIPETFPNWGTVQQILNGNAITALAALALVIPLCAGLFDLSFAYTMSLSGVTAAHFVAIGWGVVPAILIALAVAVAIGVINGLIVIKLHIDSFIGTLATGSLIQALITFVTNDQEIVSINLGKSFANVAQTHLFGFALPVYYTIAIALAIWYLLGNTSTGRRLYATGFNMKAARLTGIRVNRIRFGSFVVCALIAGFAGVLVASNIQTGSPTAGPPYLLPAFACAFFGATQVIPGRFNAWGTVLAAIVLGTGVTGLGLAAAPSWTGAMFTGVVLIAALAIASLERRIPEIGGRRIGRRRGAPDDPAAREPAAT
jgi:ribose transport system permease protein